MRPPATPAPPAAWTPSARSAGPQACAASTPTPPSAGRAPASPTPWTRCATPASAAPTPWAATASAAAASSTPPRRRATWASCAPSRCWTSATASAARTSRATSTRSCTPPSPASSPRPSEQAARRGLSPLSLRLGEDLDDVAGLQLVAGADGALRAAVPGADEVLAEVGVDAVRQLPRRRPLRHEVAVGQDAALLVGELALVLDREDRDEVQQVEGRRLQHLGDAGAAQRLEGVRRDVVEALALRLAERPLDGEGGVAGMVVDRARLRRLLQRQLGLRRDGDAGAAG